MVVSYYNNHYRNSMKHLSLAICVIVFYVTPFTTIAQCVSAGTRSATTAASVSFSGSNFNFSNAVNIFSSDNNRASATGILALFNGETDYLHASNFGFSIPPTAIICGIAVEVEKSATGIGSVLGIGLSYVRDYSVRLVSNGAVIGNNKAEAAHWTNSETYHSYGSSSDIWGVAWMPADINSPDFGIAFSASINGLAMLIPSVRLDHVTITVHYLAAVLPGSLLHFDVSANDNSALIQWKTTTEKDNTVYTVQRSQAGRHWENVAGNFQKSYVSGKYLYALKDQQPFSGESFYRLQMTEASGEISYSSVRAICMEKTIALKIYPNPFTGQLFISNFDHKENIRITDLSGHLLLTQNSSTGILDLRALHSGFYFLQIGNKIYKIQKR